MLLSYIQPFRSSFLSVALAVKVSARGEAEDPDRQLMEPRPAGRRSNRRCAPLLRKSWLRAILEACHEPLARLSSREAHHSEQCPADRQQALRAIASGRREAARKGLRPCWLQIPSAREASGANLVKQHAGSRDGHRVRGLRGRTPLSREVVESAAGDRGLGADALRCKSGRTR
jgi:hypothetical protein